jgi:hypothetical protein
MQFRENIFETGELVKNSVVFRMETTENPKKHITFCQKKKIYNN